MQCLAEKYLYAKSALEGEKHFSLEQSRFENIFYELFFFNTSLNWNCVQ